MAASYPSIALPANGTWAELTSLEAGIVSAPGTSIQNVGWSQVVVFFGGASAPTGVSDGHILGPGVGYYDKNGSAHIWAKGPGIVALSKD